MTVPPLRRWYQFSLRTMFVVVFVASIPLAWVGYHLNWIRERHEFLVPKDPAVGLTYERYVWDAGNRPPWQLALFGEKGIQRIKVIPTDREQVDRVRALFPEAIVEE